MPNIFKYYLQINLYYRFIAVCTQHCNRTLLFFHANSGKVIQRILIFPESSMIQAKYILQNIAYPKRHFTYTQEVLKSISNIQNSPKKDEKAVVNHSLHLHFYTFSGLFLLYSSQNLSAYGIS